MRNAFGSMPTRSLLQQSASPGSSGQPPGPKSSGSNGGLVLGLAIGGGAGFAIVLVAILFLLYRWVRSARSRALDSAKLQKFSYRELKTATDNFNSTQRLGQGGFGVVYKGALKNGKDIAVKKLDTASLQGEREFQNEVTVIGKVNSPHVVGLWGYCVEGRRRLLVYEYMENGSLQEALFDEMYASSLDWETRFKIILDTARGLAFLHYKCDPPIIHGDVKPSNILLDKHFAARIADFGLARLKSEETGVTVKSDGPEREHIERERIRYERNEREKARLAMERKRSGGDVAGASSEKIKDKDKAGANAHTNANAAEKKAEVSSSSEKKRAEGQQPKKIPAEQENEAVVIQAEKSTDFSKTLDMEQGTSPPPSGSNAIKPEDSHHGDAGGATQDSPVTVADATSPRQVEIDISGPSVEQSPMSVIRSPRTNQSSPSVQQESPIADTAISPGSNSRIADAAISPGSNSEIVPSDAEERPSTSEISGPLVNEMKCEKDEASPVDESASKLAAKQQQQQQLDENVSQGPDVSAKEETEPEGWSTISPSEGYRDDVSVESGKSGKSGKSGRSGRSGKRELRNTGANSNSKRLWNRDWWWRQDTNSGELTIKDFINWTPSKSVASSESKRRNSVSKDWGGAGSVTESGGDITPLSQSRRMDKKGVTELRSYTSKSSLGSERWGDFSGELTGKKKEDRKRKDKHAMREWWKEENELSSKVKKEHSRSKSRDSKAGKARSREWWREDKSSEIHKLPKSGSLLSLSREGSKRTRSREWWREEYSGELSRTNSERHSGNLRRESGRRDKSRSRDWFSGDLLGRAAVTSTPSMRGTICYVAPEYGGGGILNEKSDVYSFGVLMLVIISGRRPLQVMASPIVEFERANLISWARHLAQTGNVLDLVDKSFQGQFSKEQAVLCITVALLCLQRLPAVRPTMGEVVKFLLGEATVPTLPFDFSPSPPFFRTRRRAPAERSTPSSLQGDSPLIT